MRELLGLISIVVITGSVECEVLMSASDLMLYFLLLIICILFINFVRGNINIRRKRKISVSHKKIVKQDEKKSKVIASPKRKIVL